jgi:hypothetical protein
LFDFEFAFGFDSYFYCLLLFRTWFLFWLMMSNMFLFCIAFGSDCKCGFIFVVCDDVDVNAAFDFIAWL